MCIGICGLFGGYQKMCFKYELFTLSMKMLPYSRTPRAQLEDHELFVPGIPMDRVQRSRTESPLLTVYPSGIKVSTVGRTVRTSPVSLNNKECKVCLVQGWQRMGSTILTPKVMSTTPGLFLPPCS